MPHDSETDAMLTWAQQKGTRFEIPQGTVRLWVNAVNQFVNVLDDSDAADPQSLLSNAADICRRYSLKTQGSGETAKTYESRVRSCVQNYLAWRRDPTGWRYEGKDKLKLKLKAEAPSGSARPVLTARKLVAARPPADHGPPPGEGLRGEVRNYPVSGGSFSFVLPPAGITVADAFRIAMHVATFASDYDPESKIQEMLRASVLGK